MFELLVVVVAIALVGSLGVPVVVLSLARLGYFEPIRFHVFGRDWSFAPASSRQPAYSEATVLSFPFQRQTVFASVVTAAYSVAAPVGIAQSTQYHLETKAAIAGQIRDARRVA